MGSIAFVGDSFCASYGTEHWKKRGCTHDQFGTDEITYIDHVVRAFRYTLYPFGFGGKSWWFSRCRFLEELDRIPKNFFSEDLEVIVFCHTNPGRINNSWNYAMSNTDTRSLESEIYYKHIFDDKFHSWAQQQWFKEIANNWGHLKTIHFHCFPETVPWSDLLPGKVFVTPLIYISIGELLGTTKEIELQIVNDRRYNHMNSFNNKILGEIILETLYNYDQLESKLELDLERFDLKNPNSLKFPEGNYGSE